MFTKVYDLTLGYPLPPTIGDRVLHNDFTAEWHGRNDEVVMQREALRRQVITAMKEGNPRIAAVRAGNAVGLIHEVQAAGDIVRQVVTEAEQILRERPGQVLQA